MGVSQFMILLLYANQPVRVTLTESMNVAWEDRFVFALLSSSFWGVKRKNCSDLNGTLQGE